MTPPIETDRLRLEPLRPDHAAEMVGVLENPGLYAFTGGGPPPLAELESRYRRWIAGSPRHGETWHNWIVRRTGDGGDGPAIGHVQATVDGDAAAAEIAWVIGTAWQGRGYASEAARALVVWLESIGVTTITAHVHPGNVASSRVAARAGLDPTDEIVEGEAVWRWPRVPRRARHT